MNLFLFLRMLKYLLYLILFCCPAWGFSQHTDSLSIKNGIDNPSTLATHHFGIFSARINQNFKIKPASNPTLNISYASGNNFHPFVETYFPKDPEVREAFSHIIWHDRPFNFIDQETTPADYTNMVIDAVIKEFRVELNVPISPEHELGVTLRSYLINKGKHPFSLFTSDETVEWFHSNLAGGEDPYGRRYYGLNQVNFKYTDRYGKVLEFNNNDFFISGIELNHYYYPPFLKNDKKQLYFNFGSHLGINTSKFNASIDLGFSANGLKKIALKNNNEINIGIGANVLRKNIIDFKDNVDLGNNPFLAVIESDIEYTKYTKKRNYHAFGVVYHIQSRYNKLEEADYYVLKGKWQEIKGGWQHGTETLYKALSDWTFIYTYGRPKYKLSLYFKEDFLVNNAPDIQTGFSLKIPFIKNK